MPNREISQQIEDWTHHPVTQRLMQNIDYLLNQYKNGLIANAVTNDNIAIVNKLLGSMMTLEGIKSLEILVRSSEDDENNSGTNEHNS